MMDYTKSYSGSQYSFDQGLRDYMLKVYNYMALGLVITGLSAFVTLATPIANLMFVFDGSGQFIGNTGFSSIIMFSPILIAMYFFHGFWITGFQQSSISFLDIFCINRNVIISTKLHLYSRFYC